MKALLASFVLLTISWIYPSEALACQSNSSARLDRQSLSTSATPITLDFQSGARWELCWEIDHHSGLVLSQIHYGGPEMPLRKIMDSASIAQIVFQYDEDTTASHLLSEFGLGGEHWNEGALNCTHGEWIAGNKHNICLTRRELNLLARARHYQSLPRNEITLTAMSTIGLNNFQQSWRFSEDGELKPALAYSGKITRYTTDSSFGSKVDNTDRFASNATLLVNWRLNFNINDTPKNDDIHEFNFISDSASDLKKKSTIKAIEHESFRKTNNSDFRGWRISDRDFSSGDNSHDSPTRIGYYLDPQPSGYRLVTKDSSWTEYDIAITNQQECEKLASKNHVIHQDCGNNLTEFVSGESIQDPVVWFSLTRHFSPSKEDFPAIRSNPIEFSLIPFDWSASSPFSVLATPINPSLGVTQ